VRDYLFYALKGEGPAPDPETATFASDAEAINHALTDRFPDGSEVWHGLRLVGRFHGSRLTMRSVRTAA